MKYYAVVRQTSNGIWVPRRMLHSVNVRDGSVCYVVPGRYNECIELPDVPSQLVLSPIPHKSWGCVCNLRIRIKDEPGTLHHILEILDHSKINILFAQVGPAGLTHAALDIWGEVQEFRARSNTLKRSYHSGGFDSGEYKKEVAKYTAAIINTLGKLEDSIITEGSDYLYDPQVTKDLFSVPANMTPSASEVFSRFEMTPVMTRWIRNLALNYFYGELENAEKFVYRAKSGALEPKGAGGRNLLNETRPVLYIGAFDPSNSHIRLRQLEEPGQPAYEDRFDFNLELGPNLPHVAEVGSRGLLNKLLGAVDIDEWNLQYARLRTHREDRAHERGSIVLVTAPSSKGHLKPDNDRLEASLSASIRSNIENYVDGDMIDSDAVKLKITPDSSTVEPFRVFLSLRQYMRHQLNQDLQPSIAECVNTGARLVMAGATPSSGVSQDVLGRLSSCNGLLQILSLDKKEALIAKKNKQVAADLSWLSGEWLVAKYMGLPRLRYVDTSLLTVDEWQNLIRVDKDDVLLGCNMSGQMERKTAIENGLGRLIKMIGDDC